MRLVDEINSTLRMVDSDASWDVKYVVLFARHREVITPLLKRYGLDFEWCDPDADYEDDVRAYADALLRLKQELEKLPAGCMAFADEEPT